MGTRNSVARRLGESCFVTAKDLAAELFVTDVPNLKPEAYTLRDDIDPKLKIIDASLGGQPAREKFYEAAIPTARFLDVMQDLKDKTGKFPNTFPPEEQVKEALENIGVEVKDTIVLYAQPGKIMGVTRAYFILHSYGFKNVKILEGGLKAFTDSAYPTTQGKDYQGRPSRVSKLKNPDSHLAIVCEIAAFALGNFPEKQVVDARPANAFNGEATDNIEGCRQGHVPGAVNIPVSEFQEPEKESIKSAEKISELVAKYNLNPERDTIVMCRTGMAASVAYVALQNAGFQNLRLYDGSWSEYGSL